MADGTAARRLFKRVRAAIAVKLAIPPHIVRRADRQAFAERTIVSMKDHKRLEGNVQQWRRWHRANLKYQRRLRAIKRARGLKVPPRSSSLPRWMVP